MVLALRALRALKLPAIQLAATAAPTTSNSSSPVTQGATDSPLHWEPWSIAWYSIAMVGVGVFNIALLAFVLLRSKHRRSRAPKLPAGLTGASCDHEDYETRAYRRTQRFLAVPFVLVCAFRAFFPTIYLFRRCFIDSPLSNILAARLLASVAEVCYVTQVSLALRRTSSSLHEAASEQQRRAGRTNGFRASCSHIATQWSSQGVVLAIICAEFFSCAGTATTNSLWFTLEEGSWVFSATFLVLPVTVRCLVLLCRLRRRDGRHTNSAGLRSSGRFLGLVALFLAIYCPWGLIADVPNNFKRYLNDTKSGARYYPLAEGLADAAGPCAPTRRFEDWSAYMLWMSAYFSLNVWSSIALASWRAPRIIPRSGCEYHAALLEETVASGGGKAG